MKSKLLKMFCCLSMVLSLFVSKAHAEEELHYLDVGEDTVLVLNNEDLSAENTRILGVVVEGIQYTLEDYMDTFCLIEEENYASQISTLPGISPLYDEGGSASGPFTGRALMGTRTYSIPTWALIAADVFGLYAFDVVKSGTKYFFQAMYNAALASANSAILTRKLYRNYAPYNGYAYKYTNEFNITSNVYNSGTFYGTSYYSNNPYESI